MYVASQFSVFMVNKPGVLARVLAKFAGAKINITATSGNNPAISDMIQTTTFLLINLDFTVQYIDPSRVSDVTSPYNGEKFAEINPGSTYFATIRIQNLGTINDTYENFIIKN